MIKKGKADGLFAAISKNHLNETTITWWLKNPFYYGEFPWDERIIKGIHEPIVDKGLWETVQETFVKRSQNNVRRDVHDFLYRGHMVCGYCGSKITAELKKGKYIYYHCANNKCDHKKPFIEESKIEKMFLQALEDIHFDEEIMDWLTEALQISHANEMDYHNGIINNLRKEYDNLKTKLDLAYEDKLAKRITIEYWERRSKEWIVSMEEISVQLEAHQTASNKYLQTGIKLLELGRSAKSLYLRLNEEDKQELLKTVLSNSVLKDGSLTPVYNKPFNLLVKNHDLKKWWAQLESNQ